VFFTAQDPIAHHQNPILPFRKTVVQSQEQAPDISVKLQILHHVLLLLFDHVQQMDGISFLILSDRFIQGDFPGKFFAAAQHHQKFVINASAGIGSQSSFS
jgi:hypothetical protein